MKSANEIADDALRLMQRAINNELPTVSCPEKQQQVLWKREQVRQLLISKLHVPAAGPVGPTQTKS